MTQFETLQRAEIEFGNHNFLEIARKRASGGGASTEFLAITRGYTDGNGARRYKSNVTLPDDAELARWVVDQLVRIGVENAPVTVPAQDAGR